MAKARARSDDGPIGWLPYAYSEANTARLLGMTCPQVKTLITDRILPAKFIDGSYVVRRKDIESFQTAAANKNTAKILSPAPVGATDVGTVYVIGFGPYIKIGYTAGPLKARVASIQTGSPERLSVFGELSGSVDLEYALHLRFADLNTHGEWFRREGALAEWIEAGCPMEAEDA